ncbi:fumarylacetoacetate hydrolase family protein [Microbacterium sp. SORGH_AS_0888]|uniref:fumarylacetoacetate hydrolase family protein n=1 Tax=Microbacterium sp. SORGH_AS_0888 TaxID=3041791 RepID=UPI002785C902|nr:fumarylacetoacetate hydrolase family protein [Microbacterium sp. SORGH_AS_0888]MDQ1129637.1 2-keto-4-pentenoate hydratase/2-oxohepta-3-ene-1,7-dioic acid hydratase in catechol pathway [Microbacterium sp. SORGH_AS_0888]
MRLARWESPLGRAEGFVIEDRVVPFPDGLSVQGVLERGLATAAELHARVADAAGTPLASVRLRAPLRPASVRDFAAFEEHVEGMSSDAEGTPHVAPEWYQAPTFYFTNPHAVIGDGETVRPPVTERLDYELEVAAVIGGVAGSDGRDLTPERAEAHIFGYTIMNDWSARDIQNREMRVFLGPAKGKDFATTLGPWIVTADELASRRDAEGFLAVRAEAYIGATLVGEDLVSNMGWTFAELVAYASRASVVVPGDVLGSGTAGNGGCLGELWGRNGTMSPPPLTEGDTVRIVVEGIGEITNTIGRAAAEVPLPTARPRPLPRSRRVP